MTFTQYNEKLIADPVNTLCNQRFASFTGHDADLFKALKVEEDVFEEEPLLLDILNLLTWSGAATMGLPLMSSLIGKAESELSGSLALGVQLKLIQKNADDERYALHRLVREIRRYERPLESQDIWVNSICSQLGDWFEGLRQDFLDLPRFEAEVDHLVAWRDNAEYLAPIHACRLTWLQAYPAYHRGMYQESQKYLFESRKMYENYALTDQVLLAHILNDLGSILMWLGQHCDARILVEKALSIRVSSIGEHHPDTVLSYINLGGICNQLNEHQMALEYLNKATDIATNYLANRHSDIARAYHNIGGVYGRLKEYNTALIYNKRSLQVCRDFLGEYHPLTASSYNSVGGNYGNTGDYAKALEYSKTALTIRCELLGENHPDTASSYNNVSLIYRSLKDYESEREYSEKALKIRKELLGIYHPDTIASYHNVSLSYFKLGYYSEALSFLRKGYEYAKAVLPQGHSLLEQLSRGVREVTTKMARPGFRSPPIHIKKKKRK